MLLFLTAKIEQFGMLSGLVLIIRSDNLDLFDDGCRLRFTMLVDRTGLELSELSSS